MCVIIYLKPGQTIPTAALENACCNNWHSYGFVAKIDGRLLIEKKVPESGEVDPGVVYDLMMEHKNYERWIHLRHNTAGATTLENTHPFNVYYHEKSGRQIILMHNGTLYQYKSKKIGANGTVVDDDDGPSDTKNYVDTILIPAVAGMNFGTGIGDIHHDLFKKFISTDWETNTNRGILIASDQPHLTLGKWIKKKFSNDEEILVSNDDYFDKITRGPEHARRVVRAEEEKKRKAAEAFGAKTTPGKTQEMVELASLKDFQFGAKHGFFSLSEDVTCLLQDWDFYDRKNTISVGYLTTDEIEKIYNSSKSECIALMDYIFTDYAQLHAEYEVLEGKHEKATKMIASLKKELEEKNAELRVG